MLIAIMAASPWFPKPVDPLMMTPLFGAVMMIVGFAVAVYGYRFGSSQGSANKDEAKHVETMAELGVKPEPTLPKGSVVTTPEKTVTTT